MNHIRKLTLSLLHDDRMQLFCFCYRHSVFLGQPQYAYYFSNLGLILCLQYA